MRNLSNWVFGGVLALLVTALLAFGLAVEDTPRVRSRDDVSPADVDRAVATVRQYDPRGAPPGQLNALPLSERDIDLLAHYAGRRWLGVDTRIRLQPEHLLAQASFAAPLGRWLNVELGLQQTAGLPLVDRLRVGRLPLPVSLLDPLLRSVAARRGVRVDALLDVEWIEHVSITRAEVTFSYRLRPDTADRLRTALLAPVDQQRLRAYTERLADLTQGVTGNDVGVSQLMPPLFMLAAQRSAVSGNAVAENRAALLILTLFANHRPLGLMVPAAYAWPRARPLRVTLQQRNDLALHFLISAVIAAEAGTPLADAVGLWKELADARSGGSGFSFNDLAADHAGTRLGELAVRDPARLQESMAASTVDSDFMPMTSDLPENLPEAEFIGRFGGVGGVAYNRLLATIAARIAVLPAFQ